ncbi:MAG: hypothetical protein H0X73_05675 [Chthoniobacterales bacterium]|nr:hypothetical protein [Chthoniobacterales bacterium]
MPITPTFRVSACFWFAYVHRAEAERGDCLRAAPKAVYRQLAIRPNDIPSLGERSFPPIEHIQAISPCYSEARASYTT